jgi:hypothetical protein
VGAVLEIAGSARVAGMEETLWLLFSGSTVEAFSLRPQNHQTATITAINIKKEISRVRLL